MPILIVYLCGLVLSGLSIAYMGQDWMGLGLGSVFVSIAVILVTIWAVKAKWEATFLLWSGNILFLIGFPINALARILDLPGNSALLPSDPPSLILSFMIGSIGWLSSTLAYLLIITRSQSGESPRRHLFTTIYPRMRVILLVIAALGFAGHAVVSLFIHSAAGKDLFGNVGGMLFSVPAFFGGVAILCLYEDKKASFKLLAIILLFAVVGMGVITGQRMEIVKWPLNFLIFLLIRRHLRGLSTRRVFSALAIFLISFITLYPLFTQFKRVMTDIRSKHSGIDRTKYLNEAIASVDLRDKEDSVVKAGRVITRLSQLQYGAMIATKGLHNWGWLNGESLLHSIIVFVPRVVWHDKPTIGVGEKAYALMGYRFGTGSATVPISIDWYINLGWFGVILGMCVTGMSIAMLNRILCGNNILYNATIASLAFDLSEMGLGISGVVSTVLIYGVGSLIMFRMLRRIVQTQ